jgi:hypothetical protein
MLERRWIRGPRWDLLWIWNGVPISAAFLGIFGAWYYGYHHHLFTVVRGCESVLYWLTAVGIALELAHIFSSTAAVWADPRLRREVVLARPGIYIVLPLLLLIGCMGIALATKLGWTSFHWVGKTQSHIQMDWIGWLPDPRNPYPILTVVFFFSIGWHFSMQNFGIARLYGAPGRGWRRYAVMGAIMLVTFFAMNDGIGLVFMWLQSHGAINAAMIPVYGLTAAFAFRGIFSWNHWLAALGLGTAISRRGFWFLAPILVAGLAGFVFEKPGINSPLIYTNPLLFCGLIWLHAQHYIYDRAPIWRLATAP